MDAFTGDTSVNSTRPYLIRAIHEWCTENGFTPYLAVHVDNTVEVPRDYVKNNEIVLNVSFDATGHLMMGNEWIEFQARFGGVARKLRIPVSRVIAIYARENGQGMAFPTPSTSDETVAPTKNILDNPGFGSGEGEASARDRRAGKGPRLVTSQEASENEVFIPDPPEPTPSPQGGRPALKRVK
jgi:stringent starvation protein B